MTVTAQPLPGLDTPHETPRPGSRAARMAVPMAIQVVKEMAAEYSVCLRPVSLRRTDLNTGHTESSTCRVAPPARTSARPAPNAPAGYARPRSGRAGTAPTNPTPARDRPPRRTGR